MRDKIMVLKKVFSLILTKMKELLKYLALQSKNKISAALKGLGLHAQAKKLIASSRFLMKYAFAKLNKPSCPVCGKRRFKNFLAQPPYWIGYCRECGLGRTMPPRKNKEPRIKHEKISCEENFPERLRPCAPLSDNSFRRGLQTVSEAGLHEGCLLFIGRGFGSFFNLARKTGFTVQGVELFRNSAPCGYELFELNASGEAIGPWPEKNASFDAIMCWNVLEHVEQPTELLRILSKMLVPNGIALLRTPDFSFAGKKFDRGFIDTYLQCVYPLDLPQRRWHFSNASLTRILEAAGFAVIRKFPSQRDEYTPVDNNDRNATMAKMEEINLAREMIFLCRKPPDQSLGTKNEFQGHQ